MTRLATVVRCATKLPLGINVLRNDGVAALGIAEAVGAQFIRVNILTAARLTDQGVITGQAHEIMRLRSWLGSAVKVMADVDVKHSAPIAKFSLADEIEDTVQRGMADAIIVSGSGTGKAVDLEHLKAARSFTSAPIFLGSGVNASNVNEYQPFATGFIVGSSLKKSKSDIFSPVDAQKVRQFKEACRKSEPR